MEQFKKGDWVRNTTNKLKRLVILGNKMKQITVALLLLSVMVVRQSVVTHQQQEEIDGLYSIVSGLTRLAEQQEEINSKTVAFNADVLTFLKQQTR